MMGREITRLLFKLNSASDDESTQLSISIELIDVLLFQIDHLQLFAESNGLTEEDFSDYMDTFTRHTLH